MKEKAVPKLLSLLSPVVHSWTVFARQIGIPASLISQIRAANPPAGRSYLYTCFTQALEWWVNNHRNPTYEAIIAILDPKRGQTTPVMNRTLARQVRKFMVKEQQGHGEFQLHLFDLAVYLLLLMSPPAHSCKASHCHF